MIDRQMYYFSETRGSQVLTDVLGNNFPGYLQSDDFTAYTAFKKLNKFMKEVRCLAHIRRKFFDIVKKYVNPNQTSFAEAVLELIALIYKADKEIRNETDDTTSFQDILTMRKERVLPLFLKLKELLEKTLTSTTIV